MTSAARSIPDAPRPIRDVPAARAALVRYRVMAYVTGTFLLFLTTEIILRYVVNVHGDHSSVLGSWIAILHGWIYVGYLLAVVDCWSKMRWRLSRLAAMVLGGVVPFMSFVVEARLHRIAVAQLGGRRPAEPPMPAQE